MKIVLILAASISVVFLTACAEKTGILREENLSSSVPISFSGPWATVRVSDSFHHVGFIKGEYTKGTRDDFRKTFPWTYERHVFVDMAEPKDKITKLLTVIIQKPMYRGAYGREVRFGSDDLDDDSNVGETVFDKMGVFYKIKQKLSLNKDDLVILNQNGYKFNEFNNAYRITFRKLCSPHMRADAIFMQLDSSPEKIIDAAKNAVKFEE